MSLFVYRKTLERLLYVLALAGIGLTLHIALWYDGGGGDGDPLCGVGSNCIGVIASDPAPFGIPSAWWGFVFYVTIGLGSLLIARNIGGWGNRLIRGRAVIVGLGWIYSLFLTVLQATAIEGWCQLCLYSFSIATLIAVVTFYGLFKKNAFRQLRPAPTSEKYFHAGTAVVLLILLGLDYYNLSGDREAIEPIAVSHVDIDLSTCTYDFEYPAYDNLEQIVMDYDPVIGSPDAPILIMEFLDPNCNHCKAVHPTIKALAAKYPDSVKVVIKPVPIVGGPTYSLEEIASLYYANENGVFEEMIDLLFEHQSPTTGLSVERLSEFAEDLGLDGADFRRALAERKYSSMTVQTRGFFDGMGFTGVPAIIVNSRRVSSSSRNLACLTHFVEQAKLEL
ncbi:MAG: thioredoxin domain-containing protein [Bacteroidetes bacterium]|nr:thioredoxin domain-containing protein [Bacteroidota bacterium]